eukprot:4620776-Amphidinium_carterae.1
MVSRHSYGSAVFIQSDHGNDFEELCKEYLELTPEQAGASAGVQPRCKFEMAPFRLAESQPAGKRGMLFKQESLRLWAPRWHKAIEWLATEWVILMEVGTHKTKTPQDSIPTLSYGLMTFPSFDQCNTLFRLTNQHCGRPHLQPLCHYSQ